MNVAAFYRFIDVPDAPALREDLQAVCERESVLGTILVAEEGVNGTLAGTRDSIARVLQWIEQKLSLDEPIEARWTEADEAPFRRLRVRVKKEIVTLGRPDIRPQEKTGSYVSAADWNALIADPNTLVVDTRNHYEIEVGTFPGAVDPGTQSFREFPDFARRLAEASPDRPVAMFCTGGIRCEKATALMLELGFSDVYHLQGGILRYLAEVAPEDNKWHGECFVFDTRVAVDRDLNEGDYVQCHACRRPLSVRDLASAEYREGVSCPHCIGVLDEERAARLEERRKQVALAAGRGDRHIGPKQSSDAGS
jgi:UPF0176 protein